jgi:flagellar basal-body rod modification protein FlgD
MLVMTTPIGAVDSPTVPIGDTTPATSAEDDGTAGLLQPETFLNLLVDELKYQNPMDPTDSSTFMSQVAELSQVEQLESMSSATQMGDASDLIGKSVTGDDASGKLITGTVTGVTNGTNGPTLNVDGESVSLSEVQEVSQPGS